MNIEAGDLAHLAGLTARCTPLEQVAAACGNTCERLADRVAEIESTWGVIVGSEWCLAAWAVLQGLAQAARIVPAAVRIDAARRSGGRV
jgi:hypothetical protein